MAMLEPMEMPADPRCAGCRPAWGNQPSPVQYLKLTNSLFALEVFVKSKKMDRLEAGTAALHSVLTYLNSDPVSVRLGLTKLLASLAHALHDASQGAKPPLIFGRKTKGAPTHLAKAGLRAQVNLMFKILTTAKVDPVEAGKWLAAELKKSRILENGKSIECRQIVRWSGEKDSKSLSGSDQVYRRLEADLNRRGWPADLEEARVRVRKLIRSLQWAGF